MPHGTTKEKKHNLNEIRFLSLINHPNIVTYFRSHVIKDDVWIVMECMQGGTLNEAVKVHDFIEPEIAYVAKSVLSALSYLHKKKWVHRDLKSSNIMMTSGGEVKLIDFGLCIDLSDGTSVHMCGSPYWMSPEMTKKDGHGPPTDIWSFGICLVELANKCPPHPKNPLKALFTSGTVGYPHPLTHSQSWSDSFSEFVHLSLEVNPALRHTGDQLLQHGFLENISSSKTMAQVFSQIFMSKKISKAGF